jgi:hypothetical protein
MNYDPKQEFNLKDRMTDKPFVILYARDWYIWNKEQYVSETRDFEPAYAWIAGNLMQDKKDCVVVALEYFKTCTDGPSVRNTLAIPKESIVFMKILKPENIL